MERSLQRLLVTKQTMCHSPWEYSLHSRSVSLIVCFFKKTSIFVIVLDYQCFKGLKEREINIVGYLWPLWCAVFLRNTTQLKTHFQKAQIFTDLFFLCYSTKERLFPKEQALMRVHCNWPPSRFGQDLGYPADILHAPEYYM